MKKIIPIFLCFALLLSYHVEAEASLNITQFIIRAQSTVNADTSTVTGNTLNSTVFPDNDYGTGSFGFITNIQDALSQFDFSVLSDYDYYMVSGTPYSGSGLSENWYLYIWAFNSSNTPFVLTNDYNGSHYTCYLYGTYSTGVGRMWEGRFTSNDNMWGGSVWGNGSVFGLMDTSGNITQNNYAYASVGKYIFDANFMVISQHEADSLRGQTSLETWLTSGGYLDCSNIFAGTSGYDAQGNIVSGDPANIESNANHLYFKNCDIGFCYPSSSISPSSFGGAYFYIKYELDDWIVDHIAEYQLVFYADCDVGNDLVNTIRYSVPLDPDGCIVIPFSAVWTSPLTSYGYNVVVTDDYIKDGYYKAFLYSIAGAEFNNFGSRVSTYSGINNVASALNALKDKNIAKFLYYIHDTDVIVYTSSQMVTVLAQKFNPYKITAFTLLASGNDNSGLVEKEFDLVTGTSTYTDTTGMQNQNPYNPPDAPDDTYLPDIPGNGNSTTPSVIVYTGGNWTGNMDALITYDPAYQSLKNDLVADPNGNFTQYLTPVQSNEGTSWFMSFVDLMPSQMKAILITGVGVGVLFGLYRFIRRG